MFLVFTRLGFINLTITFSNIECKEDIEILCCNCIKIKVRWLVENEILIAYEIQKKPCEWIIQIDGTFEHRENICGVELGISMKI